MAGKTLSQLRASYWLDEHVETWCAEKKLLNIWLATNELTTVSGVYSVTLHRISLLSGIPMDSVEKHLMKDTMKGTFGVTFDSEHNVVFAHGRWGTFFKGGNPSRVAASILTDYQATRKSATIWRVFREVHRAAILQHPTLQECFFGGQDFEMLREVSTVHVTEDSKFDKQFVDTDDLAIDRETEIQTMLNRYSQELDQEDRAYIFDVCNYFSTHKDTGQPVSLGRRWQILRRLDREPVPLVGRACYEFIKTGCIESRKPFQYFLGFLTGSAAQWYKDFSESREKEERIKRGVS